MAKQPAKPKAGFFPDEQIKGTYQEFLAKQQERQATDELEGGRGSFERLKAAWEEATPTQRKEFKAWTKKRKVETNT